MTIYNAGSAGKIAPTNTPVTPGELVGRWKGDGNGVDSVVGNNGTLVNCSFTNGVVGQAFSFDPENFPWGTYSGVQIADQPAYALTNALTIEGWVRPRGDGYMIFFRGDHRPGMDPYYLSMQANNTIRFGITDADANSASVETTLIYSEWTHVAATLDGEAGTLSIFTNGVLAAQTSTSVHPFGDLLPDQSPGIGIGNLNDGGNNFPFVGDLDEISLYSRALNSASEIAANYNSSSAGKGVPPVENPLVVPATLSFTPAAATSHFREQLQSDGGGEHRLLRRGAGIVALGQRDQPASVGPCWCDFCAHHRDDTAVGDHLFANPAVGLPTFAVGWQRPVTF